MRWLLAFSILLLVPVGVQDAFAVALHQLSFGSSGSADGQFSLPHGVAVEGGGTIYVADASNHRIQVFSQQFPCGPGTIIQGNQCVPDNTALDAALAAVLDIESQRDAILTTLFEFLRVFGVI